MTRLLNWLDDRTGYRGMVRAALFEHIPGGARWRYVWGSTLIFTFVVQMITGFFLWAAYSPSSQTAWESVWYIQNEMSFGWLLRGIHHYTAQAMVVLLALHMLQVIIDGAYRAPREVNYWLGLMLAGIVLALGLTGYLLPWDQRGYWSTKVATNIMLVVPGVGPFMQRLVVGGTEYGHHTLTRFFALHAGLLPLMMIMFIGAHVYVFRRHGLRHKEPRKRKDAHFWVDQVLRDTVACLGVLLVILVLVFWKWRPGVPLTALGAELNAPADPSDAFSAARPEWYFLFLFQFLKLEVFKGANELYGAVVIPGAIAFVLFLMPLIGRWKMGHRFNIAFTLALLSGVVLLTLMAIVEDMGAPAVAMPWLTNLGPAFATAMLIVALIGGLLLFPLMMKVEGRGYQFGVGVALVLLIGVGLLIAYSLAGGTRFGEGNLLLVGQTIQPQWQRWALFALLIIIVLVLTVAVVRENVPGREPVYSRLHEFRHRLRIGVLTVLLIGAIVLVTLSVMNHAGKPEYIAAVDQAKKDSERATVLAAHKGVPPSGALTLLQEDPAFQGPRLFAQHCASCHRYGGQDGMGRTPDPKTNPQSAPDLKGFASREWLTGLFDPKQVQSDKFFGPKMAAHTGKMAEYVLDEISEYDAEQKAMLPKVVVALSAEAELPDHAAVDLAESAVIKEGRKLIGEDGLSCTDCHEYRGEGPGFKSGARRGPTLTGYGSRDWLIGIIRNPEHDSFYKGKNDRMPAYGEKDRLTAQQIQLLADWIRGDWFEPGRPPPPPSIVKAQPATQPAEAAVVPPSPPEPPVGVIEPTTRPAATTQPASTGGVADAVPAKVDFVQHVKPVLEASCVKCHGAKKQSGGMRMHTKELAFRGGDTADETGTPGIVPGNAKGSLIYQMITTNDGELRMPPDGKAPALTPGQIETIRKWIDAGAAWPQGTELTSPTTPN